MNQILGILIFLLAGFSVYGQSEQDSIILLNGRVYRGTIIGSSDNVLTYKEIDRKGNEFTGVMEYYRLFSFTQNGVEKVIYEQEELKDNFLKVEEARNATLGSYDARKTFKPRFAFWSSFALGYGVSLYDTYLLQKTINHPDYFGSQTTKGFFKSDPTFMPILAPLVLSVGWSFPSFKIKEKQMIQMHLLNDESYYRGYHRIAKQKRILGALRGSLIGIGAGLVTYAIFKP
jgi:hypothetical protein